MPTNSLDSQLSAINSITHKYFVPKLADEVTTSMALLMQMQKKGCMETVSGGADLRQPLRYARFTARGFYQGTETLDTSYNEKKFALIFPWTQLHVSPTISGLDELKNSGAAKVIDHVKSELEAAKEDIKDLFGTGLYSAGTDPKSFVGCRVYLSTSNTYGGVSQSLNSWLAAKVDSTTTVLSLGAMQQRYEACKEDNDQPDLITCTESIFNSFWSLLQPQQRYQNSQTAAAGFTSLMFNAAEVMEDSYVPTSHMIFHNLKHLKLYSHSDRNFPGKFIDFERPINQDALVSHIYWAGGLICAQPRKQGLLSALTS